MAGGRQKSRDCWQAANNKKKTGKQSKQQTRRQDGKHENIQTIVQ